MTGDYKQVYITMLREVYDALVYERVLLEERIQDARERLEELGVEP